MNIGIIGGTGTMGEVLLKGILSLKPPKNKIFFSGRDLKKVRITERKYKVRSLTNPELVDRCDLILICVKPQDFKTWPSFKVKSGKLIVSIMAGISVQRLKKVFPRGKLVRAMPNLGGRVGKSMTAWFTKDQLTAAEKVLIKKYLGSFGQEMQLSKEDDINKFTALMANGPAYLYLLMHTLEQKTLAFGFTADQSRHMVGQLIAGSFDFFKTSKLSPTELIQKVASKGGTTEAALKYLKSRRWAGVLKQAIQKGYERARQLSR